MNWLVGRSISKWGKMVLLDVNNPSKDLLEHDQKCSDTLINFIFTSKTEVFWAGHQFYLWFLRGSIHFGVFRNLYHRPVVMGQIFVRAPSTIEAKLSIYTDL